MDFLASTDSNYIMPCGVMICSVCENNRTVPLHFHIIIDESVSSCDMHNLEAIVKGYGAALSFYRFNRADYPQFSIDSGSHLTMATFYRLLIQDVLPIDVQRVIYLDCDIIVRHSLLPLWEISLDGKSLAAVPDLSEAIQERYSRLGYSADKGYFNAGMLVINLDFWRRHDLKKVFLEYFFLHKHVCLQHDQDVLNVCCLDTKVVLPLKYNSQDGFYYRKKYIDVNRYKGQWTETLSDPIVLHFTANKPWEIECDFPYKDEFFKYQKLTVWKDTPLVHSKCPLTKKQRIVKNLRRFRLLPARYHLLVKHLN